MEPVIAITRGLIASDTIYEDVPLSKVPAYLATYSNCYERTLPLILNEVVLRDGFNRAYIDLDGHVRGDMTEASFNDLCETIIGTLKFCLGIEEVVLMESCKYKNTTKNAKFIHKLSFRMHFTKLHGSKNAILAMAKSTWGPAIKKALAEHIFVKLIGDKTDCGKDAYLAVDEKPYNMGGRKMRMALSSKDNENRPLRLVDDAPLIDTLITYIPEDSVALEEPVEEPKPVVVETDASSTKSEPKNIVESAVDSSLIVRMLGGLAPHRCDDYDDWIKVGFICFNEGLPRSVWENWSQLSPKYEKGVCAKQWLGFTRDKMSQATLWMWLKEDNLALFNELRPQRTDFWSLIGNYNHAETARFFYNNKPDAYVFNESLGWFQLLPTNAWKHYEKVPSGLMTDIWITLKRINKEHWDMLDPSKETDESRIKACSAFAKVIGTKSFVDGVIAFLPSNYNDDLLHKKMDESRNLFAFANKVVDLTTKKVRDIRPHDYVCLHTGYDYPTSSNRSIRKEIMDLLFSIWEDKEVVDYVLKVIAHQLHGKKKYEEFYVWTGRGGNGKGVITEMVKRSLGDYFHSIPHDCITKRSDKKDAPNPPMALAKGKRFVQAQEPEADDKLQIGTIKELTGGDEITARQLYHDPVVFVPQFGLFLQCNTIPKLNKLDGGIKRRMVIIYFPFQFVDTPTEAHHRKINHDLKDNITKSTEWRDEFIMLLLDTYNATQDIVKPKFIRDYTDDYLAENDAIRVWLSNEFVVGLDANDKKYIINAEDLRKQFIGDTNTTASEMPSAKFKTLMEMNGVAYARISSPFNGYDWEEAEGWVEARKPSGSYYLGIRPKRKDEKAVVEHI